MTPYLLAERLEGRSYPLAKGTAMGTAGVGARRRGAYGKFALDKSNLKGLLDHMKRVGRQVDVCTWRSQRSPGWGYKFGDI